MSTIAFCTSNKLTLHLLVVQHLDDVARKVDVNRVVCRLIQHALGNSATRSMRHAVEEA